MASTVLPNGTIIPEKFSRDWYADLYHNWQELDNLLAGGTPKDGTLTIQKNGSTVGTFSANQATNETVNITVPTATSELTNDSNFVQSSDLATVATSGSYNDLSDTPTIPTVNNATLTIQQNGTTVDTFTANASVDKTININTADDTKIPLAGSNQISGSLIPSTDGTVNLGTSTNKWKTFNGINPGALSLPSGTSINVDTTNWDLTCQNELMGSFTPTADGWLMLHIANSGSNEVAFWIIGGVIRINNKSSINTSDHNNFNMFTIPVAKDVTYNIYGNASEYVAGRSIRYCRFMPCRGNV